VTAFEPTIGRYLHFDVDGQDYRVYMETSGEGIPLILQHTAGSDNRQWRHLLNDEGIAGKFAMVAADLPGHGKSLFPDESRWWASEYRLTRDFFMKFQVALAEALELKRSVFMGCSIGGHLAADLALAYPGFFRACIGLQASARTPSANEGSLLLLDNPRIGPDYAATLMRGLTSPTSPDARRHEVGFIYSQAAPGVFRGDLYYYTVDHDLRERAKEIDTTKTAIFIMSGEYDWSSTTAASKELAKAIPGAKFIPMPGLGHFPIAEGPERFRGYLIPVLEEIATLPDSRA